MSTSIRRYIRQHHLALLCLFLIVSGGTAYATHPGGANTISSGDIINGAVRTADIGTGEVQTLDIASDAVDGVKILDGAVRGPEIANNAVRTGEVGPDSLTADDLAGGSVGGSELQFGSVNRSHIAPIEEWHYIGDPGEPAFENGWHNYDGAASHTDATYQHVAYAKDQFGTVHIRGLAAGGTIGTAIFELSGTYCPWFFHAFPVISNDAHARVTVEFVQPWCNVYAATGSSVWVSLEGVSYQEWPLESRAASGPAAAPGARGPNGTVRSTR